MSHMIPDPEEYFRNLVPEREALLLRMEEEAGQEEIPIIGPVAARLLYILASATGAKRILELGTATGYSGIFLARAAAENGGRFVTVEWSPDMAARAEKNFRKAAVSSYTEILVGDAQQLLKDTRDTYDFIFMDIDKEYYLSTLSLCRKVIRPGGLLVVDNVGFQDARPFNEAVAKDPGWLSVNLYGFLPLHSPENDGLCLALPV